jgi:PadR family transcriptional regulator AphA
MTAEGAARPQGVRRDRRRRAGVATLEPSLARAYLEWADEVAQAGTEKLEKFEAEIDWTQGGTRYGRLALEWGLRFSAMQREWADWAVKQIE